MAEELKPYSFDVSFSKEEIALIDSDNVDERQRLFDSRFSLTRREEMMGCASTDVEGRPVLYYRYMYRNDLSALLRGGEITVVDLHPDIDEEVNEDLLEGYLKTYFRLTHNGDIKGFEEWASEIMDDVQETGMTHRSVLSVLNRHLDAKYRYFGHTGSEGFEFTPFISLSVGGPVEDGYPQNSIVYVEMCIPDKDIYLNFEENGSEMEVLTQKLVRSRITRIYDTKQQVREELVLNRETTLGRLFVQRKMTSVTNWMGLANMADFLPSPNLRNRWLEGGP